MRYLLIPLIAVALFFPYQVLAQNRTMTQTAQTLEERQQLREETQASRDAVVNARCEMVTSRINSRLNLYDQNRDRWYSRHQGVITRLSDLADKLDAKDCNTVQLRADIKSYEQYLADFAASFREFHTTLQGSRSYVCGQSQGQFAGAVSQSRTQLAAARQEAVALQNFFTNTLRVHLRSTGQACLAHLKLTPTPAERGSL